MEGHGTRACQTFSRPRHHWLAAAATAFWKARLHISPGTSRGFCGWLFLARLPETFKDAVQQPRFLEREIFQKQSQRSACHAHLEEKRLARPEDLGA